MSEPVHDAGWYPDPWGQARLRWHDGTDWTSHVDGAAATAPQPQASPAMPTTPTLQPVTGSFPAKPSTSGMAIASLVTALLGIWVVPIVLGVMARKRIAASMGTQSGAGLALAGIIIGAIQLLVIPLIVMAIAIPTFLAQKDAANATKAKADVKMAVNAVESCAAGNVDGSYTGCDAAGIAKLEPALATQLQSCGQPGGMCIELADDKQGYTVSAQAQLGEVQGATYTQTMASDGTLTRTCSGAGCPTGTW